MLEEGYSPGQDSSSVSSDESQAEPTVQTGGGLELSEAKYDAMECFESWRSPRPPLLRLSCACCQRTVRCQLLYSL